MNHWKMPDKMRILISLGWAVCSSRMMATCQSDLTLSNNILANTVRRLTHAHIQTHKIKQQQQKPWKVQVINKR